ncbi:MAG: hypothetical protein JSU06_11830 [Actinobacteria bacterium]|nr:hypothetical protein [Actinomycetota bacterium]
MSDVISSPLTRRSLLGSAVVGGLVLAGCGGSSSSSTPAATTGAAAGTPKKGGTFRFAPSDFSSAVVTDPQASGGTTFNLAAAFTDGLVERDHQWRIKNALAESFEPNKDFTAWTVRLIPEVEFQNGKTLEAEDVIYSIKRNVNPKAPGFTSGLMQSIDTSKFEKLDKRTVRINLKYPNSQLLDGFTEIPSCIIPVGFDPNNPIGTGPFKQKSFAPGQQWVGERFKNYWRPNMPYLDSLVLVGFSNPNVARMNALTTNQVDGVDHVLPTQVAELEQRGNIQVIVSETGAFEFTSMNLGKGYPFEDPNARMAVKLMANREQLIQSVYDGFGGLGNDTGGWHQFDPSYPAKLPQREVDIEKAKSLAKESGLAGQTVTMRVAELVPGIIPAAELMIQYAKEVGFTIKLDEVTDLAQWYTSSAYYTAQMKTDYDYTQTVYQNMNNCWAKTAPYNSVNFYNAKLESLYKQALRVSGQKYNELAGEMAKIIYEEGPWLVWGRRNIPDAYTSQFTGASPDAAGTGFNGYKWFEIGLA